MDITGTAFITGGGSGIGKACAHGLAKAGSRAIFVTDIDVQAAQKTADETRSIATYAEFSVEAVQLDITIEADVKAAVARMVDQYGRIDYCIHSAGISATTFNPVSATDSDDFKHVQNVNVFGTFLITNTVAAAMMSQEPVPYDLSLPGKGMTRGSIVNLGSLASVIALPNMVQYNTAKHGVLGITKTAAMDLVKDGIRVNCVCPAWTATPMVEQANRMFPGLEEAMMQQVPMGRLALPQEIAETVLFLCSPKSSYVTGSSMIVDGGMSLGCYR
ncbi:NAD(P)-binding protein [Hypoxylon rubiginosum]|uniref:NAD(P)-binding protein n=1 Tax=Hypoxylon rubiginosum TaxID=110542 RepID=A0ACC0D7C2_9PEZI|nr:NAD(P)-binding protein [Hypoxylon rubiginosum]